MMTNTSWKDRSTSKVAQGMSSSLHKLWRELKHFARKELFGMSLRAHRVLDAYTLHFEAVGRSGLLILERKFPETGGQHFMTLCKI